MTHLPSITKYYFLLPSGQKHTRIGQKLTGNTPLMHLPYPYLTDVLFDFLQFFSTKYYAFEKNCLKIILVSKKKSSALNAVINGVNLRKRKGFLPQPQN